MEEEYWVLFDSKWGGCDAVSIKESHLTKDKKDINEEGLKYLDGIFPLGFGSVVGVVKEFY